MAKPKDKPASRAVFGIGFLRAPDGNVVAVRGLMDLAACESLSPMRVDAEMQTRPVAHETEPDNMGRVFKIVSPTLTKVGERRVHGQSPERTGRLAKNALWTLLERAIRSQAESVETLDALVPGPKQAKAKPQETRYDKWLRAERALELLGKPDAIARRVLLAAGRSEAQVVAYLKERAEFAKARVA